MGQKPLAPRFQRFRIVQAQDFNVRYQQSGMLDLGRTSDKAGI
jgi:hypothetical protein